MGEIEFGWNFFTLLSFLHLWIIAAAGVLVTDKKVGSIGDYSSSSENWGPHSLVCASQCLVVDKLTLQNEALAEIFLLLHI